MRCSLEFNGTTHESTEFSDRQVFGMVASVSAGGINLKSLFERVLDGETKESVLSKSGLDTLFSDYDMETAERNMAHIIKKVFPSFDKPLNEVSTAELIEIVSVMVKALTEESAKKTQPIPQQIKTLGTIATPQKPRESNGDNTSSTWVYPPIAKSKKLALSSAEKEAITHVASTLNHDRGAVDCWYSWFKVVSSVGGSDLSLVDTIDLAIEHSGNPFNVQDCIQYHRMIQEYLTSKLGNGLESISA